MKYNEMENIMKLMEKASNRGGGWKREWPKNKVSILCQSIWKYFYCHVNAKFP